MLQIVLHAAAILVCVKRHNKPGWRTCLGGGCGAEREVGIFWGGVEEEDGGLKVLGVLPFFCLILAEDMTFE